MDVTEQLQAYTAQIVALGQATLAHHRCGEGLPDELAAQAAALLALEGELGAISPAAASRETAAPAEAVAAPGVTAILGQAAGAPPEPDAAAGEPPAAPGDVALMSPVEADNWLSALDEELPSGVLILDAADAAPADESLVIDVDERPGGGPATSDAAEALPPLVIDPIHDLPADGGVFPMPDAATGPAPTAGEPLPEPAADLRFCTNCGATLRPGRRFCHRCGASVAEMVAELFPAPAAPPTPPAEAPLPSRITTLPREEWPTIVSDSLPHLAAEGAPAAPAAMARFCNNCGLGLAAEATVCPDCGSRDIS